VFDLSLPKLLILAVIALVVFGPNELPKMAAKAGRALRELRKIAEGATSDLREGLGPEFPGRCGADGGGGAPLRPGSHLAQAPWWSGSVFPALTGWS
jgi:TatA/E family protein of Tat protein translocase